MKKYAKLLLYYFIVINIIFSCSKSDILLDIKPVESNKHELSIEDAIINLNEALETLNDGTKSIAHYQTIEKIETIYSNVNTKSSSDNNAYKLFYIVDFKEGGSAILAADSRIDPVWIITDNSKISSEYILVPYDKPVMNINDLYCAEDDDYYIGNNSTDTLYYAPQIALEFQSKLIEIAEAEIDSLATYQTIINQSVPPILCTKWGQGYPYNDKFGYKWLSDVKRDAGCTTVALAQILVANQDIPISTFGIYDTTWEELNKETPSSSNPMIDGRLKDAASSLTKTCADGIKVSYWATGTFSTPKRVKKYMNQIGYSNAEKIDNYSYASIINSLSAGKPVFIAALSNSLYGHAWVIDGYITNQVTYSSGVVDRQILLHCNWGWDGYSDGFYNSKIFDSQVWSDNSSNPSEIGFDASMHYRLIIY